MKFISLKIILLLMCIAFAIQNEHQKWCWTRSQVNNPGFILDDTKGGFNWGYCKTSEESKKVTTIYSGNVITSVAPGSITSSQVKIKLCGSLGCFPKWITISATGYNKTGVKEEIEEFNTVDVGEIQKLKVRIDGVDGWSCKNINIMKDSVETKFECLRRLEPCSVSPDLCEIESLSDGSFKYEVELKVGDGKEDGSDGPFHILLYGDKKVSQEKILTDKSLQPGELLQADIYTEDIGSILGFKLILKGEGNFRPILAKIRSDKTNEERVFKLENVLLTRPGNPSFEIRLKDENSEESSDKSEDDFEEIEEKDPSPKDSKNVEPSLKGPKPKDDKKESLNVHDADGGLISNIDKKRIVNLSCAQIMENSNQKIFGPDYPTKNNEYMSVLARCPVNCDSYSGVVYGVSIHPSNSPICLSAIVDGVISPYGGIINISIYSGLEKYKVPDNFPTKIENITVKDYEGNDIKKSYSVSKIDNVDLVEKDFRILNADGKLSNKGRIEVRVDGEWGSICNLGNDEVSARIICKDLGYKNGNWIGKSGEKNCENIDGRNYCGSSMTKIHFSNLNTTVKDSTFKTVNKNFADRVKCNHSLDAIVNCTNDNFENKLRIPNKTVRLDGIREIKETKEIIGRLELFMVDKFKPVCNSQFNKASAKVSCKMMGYDEGFIYENDDKNTFKMIGSNEGFSVTNLECNDFSKDINSCRGIYNNISCSHDNDVVIKCKGKNGDYTGKSQYLKPVKNNPPELGKLGLLRVNIECKTEGNDIRFRGDPASIFMVCCPAGCENQPGTIWGTGVYSSSSQICLAAHHTGILDNESAGCFVLTKNHGLDFFKGNIINSIESQTIENIWSPSFHLSEINSGWLNMNKQFFKNKKENPKKTSFIALQESTRLKKMFYKERIYSFLELKSFVLPNPIFTFLEKNPNHIFSDNDNYVFEGGKLTKVNDFTVFFKFEMYEFKGQAIIFSFKGSDGFNIFINKDNQLYLGNMTDIKFQYYLGLIVPLNCQISVFAVYKEGKLSSSISVKEGSKSSRSGLKASFDIPTDGHIGLGRASDHNKYQFTGKINYMAIYPQALSINAIPAIKKDIRERKGNTLQKEYTVDLRLCVSQCVSSAPKTGNPPPEAALNSALNAVIEEKPVNNNSVNINFNGNSETPVNNSEDLVDIEDENKEKSKETSNNLDSKNTKPNNEVQDKNDVKSSNNPSPSGMINPNDKQLPPYPGMLKLSNNIKQEDLLDPFICDEDTTLENEKFKNIVPKQFFKVVCPKMKSKNFYPLYGFAIYRANSSICRAALHFGFLREDERKELIVRVEGPQKAYNGGMGKYEITSEDVVETENKLSFTIEKNANLKTISCETTLSNGPFMNEPFSSVVMAECPKNCANTSFPIFGGPKEDNTCDKNSFSKEANCIYSEDSSLCKSAIHCGVLNNSGGFIEIRIEGEQPKFSEKKSYGVESQSKGPQLRSFSFVGEKSAIFANYKENYEGSFLDKYLISESSELKYNKNTTWNFYNDKTNYYNKDGKKEEINSVKFTGNIYTILPLRAASIIKKKDLDFAAGLFKFNLLLHDSNPLFVFFRYVDTENNMGIIIESRKVDSNITLFINVNGSIKILATKSFPIELKSWQRFQVYLYSDSVKVTIQEEKIRQHKELFAVTNNELSRGSIAFGTNDNSHFYISGISVEPFVYNPNKDEQSKVIGFDSIMNKCKSKPKVKYFCSKKMKFKGEDLQRCMLPRFFATHICQNDFEDYGITFLRCVNSCISYMKEDTLSIKKEEKTFKENEKCDFMPIGLTDYFAGTVMKVEDEKDKKVVTVEYTDVLGNKKSGKIDLLSDRIDKCGKKLSKRTDC